MKWKIVSDSSSNLLAADEHYCSVPLKIITDQKEYPDVGSTNVQQMVADLQQYKGKSGSSCQIEIIPCTALCSFYAEQGGLLVGFESICPPEKGLYPA